MRLKHFSKIIQKTVCTFKKKRFVTNLYRPNDMDNDHCYDSYYCAHSFSFSQSSKTNIDFNIPSSLDKLRKIMVKLPSKLMD